MKKSTNLLLGLLLLFASQLSAQDSKISLHLHKETIKINSNIDHYVLDTKVDLVQGLFIKLITFSSIPDQPKLDRLEELGIVLQEYIPHNSYLVSFPKTVTVGTLKNLGVIHIQSLSPSMKTSKRLEKGDFPDWAFEEGFLNLSIRLYPGISPQKATSAIKMMGGFVNQIYAHTNMMDIQIDERKLNKIIDLPIIRFVDLISEPGQKESDDGRNLHRSNAIDNDYYGGLNYDGTGVTIAINDDGMVGPHIDFTGRVNQQDVAGDMTGTHGDMTTGIAGGAGNLDPLMRGMAPASYIHVRQYTSGMSGTLPLHQDSAVLVFNSSYSNGCNAGYTNTTLLVDQEIYNNPTLMQTFSAGNSNNQDCGYGAGNQWGNITGGHKIGKNVIATANLNANDGIISSSSRGPASDGRIKPDIAAHGNSQMSTDPNNMYAPGGGTSAAAPGICGVMAQLHHAYQSMNSGTIAPSALLKAAMLNTANDLGNDGPDFIYGWGKINAYKAAKLLEENRYLSATVAQGDSNTHSITIPAGVQRAKIMVYWADPEASTSAAFALVNDLDASVSDPSMQMHLPWILDATPNAATLALPATKGEDHLNNVEQVAIDNPTAGTYNLKVKGTTIPFGAHQYWVVYEFLMDDITVTFPMGGEGLLPGTQDRIHWDAYGNTGTFTIEYSDNAGASWNSVSTAAGSARFVTWNVPASVTGQGRIRITRGSASDESDANFSIMERPQNIRVNRVCPDLNTIQLAWDPVSNATGYDVFMLGQKFMDSVGTTAGLQFNVSVPDVNQNYWFSVRARGANGMVSLRQIAIEHTGSSGGTASCFLSCSGDNDAGVDQMISPQPLVERCGGISSVPVQIVVENIGLFTESNIPVFYQFDNGTIISETVASSIAPGATTNYTFSTPINFTMPGTYELKVWTGLVNDSTSCNDTIYQTIDILDPNGSFPYAQDFETGVFPGPDITLINADADLTWQRTGVTGADGNATNAVYVNNYSYNAIGQEDIFQILTMDLTTGTSAQLTFDIAYLQYSATYSDDLRVDISTDCGQTYSQLYFKDGATLSGGNTSTQNWAPSAASDWQQEVIDLSTYLGGSVTLRFVNINGWGQNLYIDNINIDVNGLAPAADFDADVTVSCDGVVQFTDLSGNAPTQWLWQFGDGGVSTQQNPSYTYNSSGSYTVTLQATNALGTDTEVKNLYITVEFPGITSVTNGEACINTPVLLSATNGSGDLHWYDSTGSLVSVGDTFITSPLANAQTYFVKDVIDRPTVQAGPADNNFGTGGYHGSGFYGAINFTADTNFTILSAWVDANGAGDRIIYLWDGNIANGGAAPTNTVLQQITVTMVDGPQRINLNIDVPSAGDYSIGGNQMNLYRNNSGPVYPYVTPGLLSMTSSTANNAQSFYYYLYDWEIGIQPCESAIQVVTANVVDAQFSMVENNGTVSFTDNSTGAYSWLWDFGDGNTSTQQNPVHTYGSSGPFVVTLTINNGSCTKVDTLTTSVSITTLPNGTGVVLSPNPTDRSSSLIFDAPTQSDYILELRSVDGRLISTGQVPKGSTEKSIDVRSLPAGMYLIQLTNQEVSQTMRLIKRD